jgi:hypothetical protein
VHEALFTRMFTLHGMVIQRKLAVDPPVKIEGS